MNNINLSPYRMAIYTKRLQDNSIKLEPNKAKLKEALIGLINQKVQETSASPKALTHKHYREILQSIHDYNSKEFHPILDEIEIEAVSRYSWYSNQRATGKIAALKEYLGIAPADLEIKAQDINIENHLDLKENIPQLNQKENIQQLQKILEKSKPQLQTLINIFLSRVALSDNSNQPSKNWAQECLNILKPKDFIPQPDLILDYKQEDNEANELTLVLKESNRSDILKALALSFIHDSKEKAFIAAKQNKFDSGAFQNWLNLSANKIQINKTELKELKQIHLQDQNTINFGDNISVKLSTLQQPRYIANYFKDIAENTQEKAQQIAYYTKAAEVYSKLTCYDIAANIYKEKLNNQPFAIQCYTDGAQTAIKNNNFPQALNLNNQAKGLGGNPELVTNNYNQIINLGIQLKEYEAVAQIYEDKLQNKNTAVKYYSYAARQELYKQNIKKAVDLNDKANHLAESIKIKEGTIQSNYQEIAQHYSKLGDYDEAAKIFTDKIHNQQQGALVYIEGAKNAIDSKNFDRALKLNDQAYNIITNELNVQIDDNPWLNSDIIKNYNDIAALLQNQVESYSSLAEIYLKLNDSAKAIDYYKLAAQNSRDLIEQAQLYSKLMNLEQKFNVNSCDSIVYTNAIESFLQYAKTNNDQCFNFCIKAINLTIKLGDKKLIENTIIDATKIYLEQVHNNNIVDIKIIQNLTQLAMHAKDYMLCPLFNTCIQRITQQHDGNTEILSKLIDLNEEMLTDKNLKPNDKSLLKESQPQLLTALANTYADEKKYTAAADAFTILAAQQKKYAKEEKTKKIKLDLTYESISNNINAVSMYIQANAIDKYRSIFTDKVINEINSLITTDFDQTQIISELLKGCHRVLNKNNLQQAELERLIKEAEETWLTCCKEYASIAEGVESQKTLAAAEKYFKEAS